MYILKRISLKNMFELSYLESLIFLLKANLYQNISLSLLTVINNVNLNQIHNLGQKRFYTTEIQLCL